MHKHPFPLTNCPESRNLLRDSALSAQRPRPLRTVWTVFSIVYYFFTFPRGLVEKLSELSGTVRSGLDNKAIWGAA